MTTTAAQGPARVPTPRPRAPLAAGPDPDSVTTSTSRPPHARTPQENNSQQQSGGGGPGPRRGARAGAADPLGDRATAFLIRRTLCPQHTDKGKGTSPPIEELLPPLTSRNDVDLQLYALIAILLREFVQNWYNKITPDETFVAEIVQIIAHITLALEQRLRKVDLESLLLDELPGLLDKHITAYRTAHEAVVHHPLRANPKEIYHSLCPLPALSPVPRPSDPSSVAEQAKNEGAYRQLLVNGILAVLLPTEDLENACLTSLVGQVFSELIIANAVASKLSEPWLIYEALIIASRTVLQKRTARGEGAAGNTASKGSSRDKRATSSIHALFWTVLQWCFLATAFFRSAFAVLLASRSVPFRVSRSLGNKSDFVDQKAGFETMHPATSSETNSGPVKTPVLAFRCWATISNLIEMDMRMPWLHGTLSLLQWIAMTGPGRIASVDGRLDRLLSHGIHRYLLDPAGLPPLLRNIRGALFPNNMPGTPTLVAPSSEGELFALRRRCASALWALVPMRRGVGTVAGRLFFNGHLFASSSSGIGGPASQEEGDSGRDRSAVQANASADASAFAPQVLTGGEQEGSALWRRQHGQGHLSPVAPVASSDVTAERKDLRSAPRKGGLSGGGQSSGPGSLDAVAAALATDDAGHTNKDEEAILDEIERSILAVFSDAYCNKHLVYGIVELILVRLLPELAEKGVNELWADRLA